MRAEGLVLLFAFSAVSTASHLLSDFGAVPNDSSNEAARVNSLALKSAFDAANAQNTTDRTVYVPPHLDYTFFMVSLVDLRNVTLCVDGVLRVSDNISAPDWPSQGKKKNDFNAITMTNCTDITITGSGVIDGQGYNWWWQVILTAKDWRPHLISCVTVERLTVTNILLKNSPQFHLRLAEVKDVVIRDMVIEVDVEKQKSLFIEHSKWDHSFGIPTFPLNTDGIDPAGVNVLIENVTITNFDDAVAVKPYTGQYGFCSQNMMIRNSRVNYGVGMTIGSVPPHNKCVRNITFENIEFDHAIKAIYVKTNPGDTGTTFIDNITYRNITGTNSLWYPIWIGPQQQRQPGTAGTGCSFFYPIVNTCPTQPRVTVSNITLENVHFSGIEQWTLPGVIICNASNPCTDFKFINVTNTGSFFISKDYNVKNVYGTSQGCHPDPGFEDSPQSVSFNHEAIDTDVIGSEKTEFMMRRYRGKDEALTPNQN